ncbi:MAG: hypothetical protein LWY06_03530 [Firmicutes bacterium]|nr:hypothetical protein [Bacillota bacterium]
MIKDVWFVQDGGKDIETLIPLVLKEASEKSGEEHARKLRWHLYYLLSDEKYGKAVLVHRESKKPAGFCLFGSSSIDFVYISSEISDRKIASYTLLDFVAKKMLSAGAGYIVADCRESTASNEDIMQNLSFYDFFEMFFIRLKREKKSYLYPEMVDGRLLENLSFYSYFDDEHKNIVLDFLSMSPDLFAEKLFEGRQNKNSLFRDYYRYFLFGEEYPEKPSFDPDLSTVVFGSDNVCVGVLLCTGDGDIQVLRASSSGRTGSVEIISELLYRTLFNSKSQYKIPETEQKTETEGSVEKPAEMHVEMPAVRNLKSISIALPEYDRKLIRILKKSGFSEIGEYRNWGFCQESV